MNNSHKSMRNLPTNRLPPQLLHSSRSAEKTINIFNRRKEFNHESATKRLTARRQGTGGIFYRQRAHRSPVRGARSGARARRERHLRARRPLCMAHPPARADADRHGRVRLDAKRRRSENGNTSRRRGVVPAERKALAWRHQDDGDDPYRDTGTARRQGRRVAGKSQRRTIRGLIASKIEIVRVESTAVRNIKGEKRCHT